MIGNWGGRNTNVEWDRQGGKVGHSGMAGRAPGCQSRVSGFKSTCCHLETRPISFTSLCLRLSEEALKAIGPFYLVSRSGEVKNP